MTGPKGFKTEKNITLDTITPQNFYGHGHARLNLLKAAFPGAVITTRGKNIKISSDLKTVHNVSDKIDFIISHLENGSLNDNQFSELLANNPLETIISGGTEEVINKLFTSNGWVINKLKENYDVKLSYFKTKISLISQSEHAKSNETRQQAVDVLEKVIALQKGGASISEKHLSDLMSGKKFEHIMTQANSNQKAVTEKKHPLQIEVDLDNAAVIDNLFTDNQKFVYAIQSFFDVKIARADNATAATIRPSSKVSRKPLEINQQKLLVSQAQEVLEALAPLVAAHQLINDKIIAELTLEKTSGADNFEKTQGRVFKYLGASAFNSLKDEEEQTPHISTALKKTVTSTALQVGGTFGVELMAQDDLTKLFAAKLNIDLSYYGRDKRLTLTKRRNSKIDLATGEAVINYAYAQHLKVPGSLNLQNIDNAIENVLHKRPVDFVETEKKTDLLTSERRQAYKLMTYNKSGENKFMYPRTESQYTLSEQLLGVPSHDPKASYENGKKIVLGIGPAASGKTSWAIFMAVQAFQLGLVKKIVLCRPSVASDGKTPPALPGGMKEKTAPFLMPLYENLRKVMPEAEIGKYLIEATAPGASLEAGAPRPANDGKSIEITQLEYLRGRTFEDAIVIGDELQNATDEQVRMFFSRLGKGSRAFASFDFVQIDLPRKWESGAITTIKAFYEAKQQGRAKDIALVACNGNLRDPVVGQVLDAFSMLDNGVEITEDSRDKTVEDYYKTACDLYNKKLHAPKQREFDMHQFAQILVSEYHKQSGQYPLSPPQHPAPGLA